ncbi:nuclear transport factor 2 family protein [Peterkaempfera griseoplana]|uniref:nuclear transport factor 2 family protein n=1 Tax=Peterkaempfera griseoplana TaxID=66896 RepID=UPI0006E20DD3|nr:nuclear transport factor 2 family protein [Peterkaempfera griseoplana]
MTATPAQVAAAYFETWKARDFTAFRALLADDVTFSGPLGRAADAEECVQGIRGMSQIVTDVVVERIVADGADVITWFQLHTSLADPVPVANWSRVENGLITRIRVAFDARSLTGGAAPS